MKKLILIFFFHISNAALNGTVPFLGYETERYTDYDCADHILVAVESEYIDETEVGSTTYPNKFIGIYYYKPWGQFYKHSWKTWFIYKDAVF